MLDVMKDKEKLRNHLRLKETYKDMTTECNLWSDSLFFAVFVLICLGYKAYIIGTMDVMYK